MIVRNVRGILLFLFFFLHSGSCLEYLSVFVRRRFTNHGFLIAGWWRPNGINAWLLGGKSSVCLCKGRHLLPDKTATSAKGLLTSNQPNSSWQRDNNIHNPSGSTGARFHAKQTLHEMPTAVSMVTGLGKMVFVGHPVCPFSVRVHCGNCRAWYAP